MKTDKPLSREDVEKLLQEAGSSSKLVLNGCTLRGLDLSGLDLSSASMYEVNLSGADLSQANLSQTKLDFANLSGADLSSASMYEVNLSGADLSGADLSGANLVEAYLGQANLSNANLNSANLVGAYLDQANLSGTNLSGVDLSGTNLSGVDLSQAYFGQAEPSEVSPGNVVTNLFRGRINRRSYNAGSLVCYSVSLIALWIFSRILFNSDLATIVGLVGMLVVLGVVVLFAISLTIRRLHDLDKDGSSLLDHLFSLPYVEGTAGPNRYGPPPRPTISLFSDPTQKFVVGATAFPHRLPSLVAQQRRVGHPAEQQADGEKHYKIRKSKKRQHHGHHTHD